MSVVGARMAENRASGPLIGNGRTVQSVVENYMAVTLSLVVASLGEHKM
jgi:hypothetical protein